MTTMTAAQVRAQTAPMDQVPDPQVPERPRPPRTYPAVYKLRILEEYEQLDKAGKGALLRREGLYTSLISEWRRQRDKGALQALQQRRGRPPVDPRARDEQRRPGRRGPGGQRAEQLMAAVEQAVATLAPAVGTVRACRAVGQPR